MLHGQHLRQFSEQIHFELPGDGIGHVRPARRWTADVRSSGIETLTLRAVPAGSALTRPRPAVSPGSSGAPSRT